MLFEKQPFQEDCVSNIVQVVGQCDAPNHDFSALTEAIKTLHKERGYHQFKVTDNPQKPRIDVLMETGTGKTFTYLKTILELNKHYKQNKFVIVVPRTAIKLGVIQNINLTANYFFNEYKRHINFIDFPKEGLAKIHQDFLKTDDLSVLITTNSAFNSQQNKIKQRTETLFNTESTWSAIHAKKPIIIIDEPHLLKGVETQKGLDELTHCLQIRFGATYPTDPKDKDHHLSNVVYSLDSISAFNSYLVKRIRVNTVFTQAETSELKLVKTQPQRDTYTVVYSINTAIYSRDIRRGDDIGAETGLIDYIGVIATKITSKAVALSNHTWLTLIKDGYNLGDDEIRAMVHRTIRTHFTKEEQLFKQGIKTLSLFFIPQVADFRENKYAPNEVRQKSQPRIKAIFEQEYKNVRQEFYQQTTHEPYKQYLDNDFSEEGELKVHEGYFSGDKGTTDNKEADGVNTILNDKEKLLSFSTPLRFIFSVWALQEGWDNPNVFNICKLAATAKDISRRQQVGRGLRVAVNQQGKRLTHHHLNEKEAEFYNINTLDMVVSAQEKEFIQNIQQEIKQASYSLVGNTLDLEALKNLGLSDTESALLYSYLLSNQIIDNNGTIQSSIHQFIKNNRDKIIIPNLTDERYQQILAMFQPNRQSVTDGNSKPETVKIRAAQWRQFRQLWETINQQAQIIYKNIEQEELIKTVAQKFAASNITAAPSITKIEQYDTQKDRIEHISEQENTYNAPSFFTQHSMDDFFGDFVKAERLPMLFAIKLFNAVDKTPFKINPQKAKETLLKLLKDTIHGSVINQVEYQFASTTIYPNSLQNENKKGGAKRGRAKKAIPHTALGQFYTKDNVQDHLLYDTICYDSNIEKTAQQQDPQEVNNQKITVFAKLPKINIPTPYKEYNPDFAYLIERQGGKKLFLIVEAKGYNAESDIPTAEKNKIEYAKKFFAALNKAIPDIEIQYKTRLNTTTLHNIITDNQ